MTPFRFLFMAAFIFPHFSCSPTLDFMVSFICILFLCPSSFPFMISFMTAFNFPAFPRPLSWFLSSHFHSRFMPPTTVFHVAFQSKSRQGGYTSVARERSLLAFEFLGYQCPIKRCAGEENRS